MSDTHAPLRGYQLIDTADADEARDLLSEHVNPHQLQIVGDTGQFHTEFSAVRLGSCALACLDYGRGARTVVTPHQVDGMYLMHMPLRGAVDVYGARERVTATPTVGAVAQPAAPFRLDWHPDSPQLLVWFDAAEVQRTLWRMLGRPAAGLRFNLGQDLTAPPMRSWVDLIQLVSAELDRGRNLTTHPLVVRHLQHLVTSGLLVAARHSLSEQLHEVDGRQVLPRQVRQAVDWMYGHAQQPITVEEVAAAVGVGSRALQHAFRRHLDTTPSTYLRSIRLRAVYDELAATPPGSGVTVTDVATRWGFLQLGKFAAAYRRELGENPSVTLGRA